MSAPIGNNFWERRAKHGRDKLFASPELLWEAACEYFEWIKDNPLMETKAWHAMGIVTKDEVPLMRAMTLKGLCFYLNCHDSYFRKFKSELGNDEQDFFTVIKDIEDTIYNQKFEGAAANLLNPNIIARDLGLVEKKEVENKGPIQVNISKDEAKL